MRVEFLEERQVFAAWIAQGPGPTINAQVSVSPNDDINGGIQAIAPHPSDANTVYVGATNGGVWKTTNASSTSPNWIPLTDGLRSQSISDVQFDVTDSTFQTLIVGTGRLSNFAQRGDEEIGLYYTTNGGSAWTTISDPLLVGQKIMGVAARGSTMLAGSLTGGMVRSTNGGLTWANISGANGLAAGGVYTLVADPSNMDRFYTAVIGVGLFRTDDAGASWNDVTAGLTGIGPDRHIRIAVHHSLGNNVVYIAVAGSGAAAPTRVFRSTNQGANWTALDTVVVHNGGQQFPDTSLAADPTNPNIVYLAGDRIAASPFTSNIVRGDATLPSGTQWTSIVDGNAGNTTPHADTRDLDFAADGSLLESDDGGIYRRTNPTSSAGAWSSTGGNIQAFEVHDVAWNAVSKTIVGGFQNNGTHQQPSQGSTTWNFFNGGDGGDVAVDSVSLAVSNQAIRYYSSQNLGGFRRQVTDINNSAIGPPVALAGIPDPQFVTPIELNSINPSRLLIGGSSLLYESNDQGSSNASIGGPGANRNAMVYGGALAGVPNADLIYVGYSNQVWKRTAPGALAVTTALPPGAGTITDVAIDPTNYDVVFAVDSNQVFMSNNGGTSWSDITGNLASASPGLDLRTIEFVNGAYVAIGTRSGVFASQLGGYGTWVKVGTNLPDVLVFDLEYNSSDNVLVAGTLGRSVWTLPNASAEFAVPNGPPVVNLANVLSVLMENTNTLKSVKVADIVVTDDAFGIDTLSLSGADATSFAIINGLGGPELHIKSGVVLDLESKGTYSVTVNVDDGTLGSTIDSSVDYNLTLTGVNEFAPVLNPIADLTISSGTVDGLVALIANDPDVGDILAFGATAQSIEYYLDQTLGFGFSGGNEYLNYFGLNEKWLTSASGKWYYVIPNGNLYRWSGGALSNDPLIEKLSPADYNNTALLFHPAINNAPTTLTVVNNVLTINPSDTTIGRFAVTATVNDGLYSVSQSFFVNVLSGAVDNTSPTVINRVPVPGSTISGSSTNMDVTFSEPVNGVDATDLVLTGSATIGAVKGVPTNIGNNTWRFPVSGLGNGTINIQLALDANDIEDTAGNDVAPLNWNYSVSISTMNQPPVLAFIGNQSISSGAVNGIVTLSANDPNVGDTLTLDATAQSIEYYLDRTLKLGFCGGNEYLNYLGLNEKWLSSAGGTWHYITPNGRLFRWLGGSPANDVLVEQLGPSDYSNTALLHSPLANNAPAVLSVVGNVLTINPNDMFVGRMVVTATVSDGHGGKDSKTFFVSVLATGVDMIAPTVTNRIPALNSTINVSTTNIDVTFSETVAGLDATDLVLTGSGATAIIGTPTHLGGNTWRFRVSGLFNGTVNVLMAQNANDIEDTSGNDLAPVFWSFNVSNSAVNQPPVLTLIGDQDISSPQNTLVLSLSASDPDVGDIQTFSVSGQSQAYFLDQSLGLRLDRGDDYLNWGGLNEKWMIGNGDTWYYITPTGLLYRWLRGSNLSGDLLVATLDSDYWSNTSKLYDAEANNAPATLSSDGSLLTIDPNGGFVGVFYVTVVVTDGSGGTDSEQFKVTVR